MTQPPFGNQPPFGYQPSPYQYPPQQHYPLHQQQHYPLHQHHQPRPQRAPKPKPTPTPEPPFTFTNLTCLPWICENCNRYFTDVFEAGSHEMVTGHDKGREMTEKEVLEKREEEKRVELDGLRKVVGNTSQDPVPVGYQGKTPTYTPSTIPGLGPVPNAGAIAGVAPPLTSTSMPQLSSESELNRLRRENVSLKFQIKDLKTKVMPRIDALAKDLKSLNGKAKEHELQIHYLVIERDHLKAEVDTLKGGEAVAEEHEEFELDMDFS